MSLSDMERAKAFMDNLDDRRHGTKTGYWLAPCHCPKCEEYRREYNAKRRERYLLDKRNRELKKKREGSRKQPRVLKDEVCTIDEVLKPMMGKPSVIQGHCVVCGSTEMLEQHHPVKRSEGKWVVCGREVQKPTLTLCRRCHEKVHHVGGLLYFKWVQSDADFWNGKPNFIGAGHWEFLEIGEEQERRWRELHKLPNGSLPSKIGYMNALEISGWRKIR